MIPADHSADYERADRPPKPERLLHAAHVAGRLGVSVRTVRYWAEVEELPGFKIGKGKLWRFRETDIVEYVRRKSCVP